MALPDREPPEGIYKKDNDMKMIIDKLNYIENRLNQLTQQFKAHRDKKEIHIPSNSEGDNNESKTSYNSL